MMDWILDSIWDEAAPVTGRALQKTVAANTTPLTATAVILFTVCTFCANLGFAICGFGSGMDMAIIFLFIYTVAEQGGHLDGFDVKYAIFLQCLGLLSAVPVVMAFSKIRKNANPTLLKIAIPATIVGSPVGVFVNQMIPFGILYIVMGLQMCVIALRDVMPKVLARDEKNPLVSPNAWDDWEEEMKAVSENKEEGDAQDEEASAENEETEDEGGPPTGKMMFFTGLLSFVSSYLSGMVGCRGAPLVILILRVGGFLSPEVIRATGSVALGVNVLARFIYYIAYKLPGASVGYFVAAHWPLYICIVIFGVIGALLGEVLSRRLHRETFKTVVAAYFIISAVMNFIKASTAF